MTDIVLFQKTHPCVGLRPGNAAIAIGIHSTPFRDKQCDAVVHCGTGSVTQPLAMRSGIKMQGVRDVAKPGNGIVGCGRYILGPVRRADNNEVIGIDLADGGDDRFRIRFNCAAPGNLQGFIIDFIDHMIIVAIASGHILEKADGLGPLVFSGVRVPVDNDIYIVGDCGINQGNDAITIGIRIFKKAAVDISAHGRPHDSGAPIIF